MTLLLADLQRPEVDIRPIPKVGRNAVVSCEVRYDDLPVAVTDRVGEEGEGFRYLLDGLNPERILVAAEALGIGRAAIRKAVAYANERVVFGRPIGKNQGVAFPLAEAYARAARRRRSPSARRPRATTTACRAASRPTSPSGSPPTPATRPPTRPCRPTAASATRTEYDVERYWREARLMRIAPISPGAGPRLRRRARARPAPVVLMSIERPDLGSDSCPMPNASRRSRRFDITLRPGCSRSTTSPTERRGGADRADRAQSLVALDVVVAGARRTCQRRAIRRGGGRSACSRARRCGDRGGSTTTCTRSRSSAARRSISATRRSSATTRRSTWSRSSAVSRCACPRGFPSS